MLNLQWDLLKPFDQFNGVFIFTNGCLYIGFDTEENVRIRPVVNNELDEAIPTLLQNPTDLFQGNISINTVYHHE